MYKKEKKTAFWRTRKVASFEMRCTCAFSRIRIDPFGATPSCTCADDLLHVPTAYKTTLLFSLVRSLSRFYVYGERVRLSFSFSLHSAPCETPRSPLSSLCTHVVSSTLYHISRPLVRQASYRRRGFFYKLYFVNFFICPSPGGQVTFLRIQSNLAHKLRSLWVYSATFPLHCLIVCIYFLFLFSALSLRLHVSLGYPSVTGQQQNEKRQVT